MNLNEIPIRNRTFDHLGLGDTIHFVKRDEKVSVKIVAIDADTVTIEGGRVFNRATGNAMDGGLVYITL